MSTVALSDLKQDVAQALTSALSIPVYDAVPERLEPTAAVVASGDPMLQEGETFCEYRVNLELTVFLQRGSNDITTRAYDALVQAVVQTVNGWENYYVTEATPLYLLRLNNREFVGGVVNFYTNTTLGVNG